MYTHGVKDEIKLFVVVATKGEYSDRSVHTVKAFYTEDEAKDFITKQLRRDILQHVFSAERSKIVSDLLREWKEENPMPVLHQPEKPIFHYPHITNRHEAQTVHNANIAAWREECRPLREEYETNLEIWRKLFEGKREEFTKISNEKFTENMITITTEMMESFDKVSYHIDEIFIAKNIDTYW